ncbi:CPBP family intramembrane glutamic endopeptidase [Croceitalea rosinachiae]|uniref:Type II CAAX endopeptidase family protein n=1 Tax=Croceitalea rosinachiae TaxID=3075596 RepID=A0ABU3ACG7_9FLAO|nr:type II CAAX endopeptidase family protein [Croceitalea sp. F388]MDT0606616.1 type II CAAX endopeptidase family protein [Croceitalea sp. F388]
MTIPKSIFQTILFLVILELIGTWVLFGVHFDIFELILRSKFINSLPQLLIILYFLYRVNGLHGLVISKTFFKFYLFALLLGISAPFIQEILKILYYQEIPINLFQFQLDFSELMKLNSIAGMLIIPFSEEFFFRHYIQKGLQEKYMPLISILVTSVLFGAIHLTNFIYNEGMLEPNFYQSFAASILGILTGILYFKSKSVGPPIILHIIWNMTIYITLT